MQRPLSTHWADITAFKLVKQRHCSAHKPITVASGITPSGTVHVGNFREVITADFIARSLRRMGYKVRFIYSWDNFDVFRSVPKNFPPSQDKDWSQYLGQCISQVPDPWQEQESLAAGRMKRFEQELQALQIQPHFIYQQQRYQEGVYAELMQKALQHTPALIRILNAHRSSPLPQEWLPVVCYCKTCGKTMDELSYDGTWTISGPCPACGSYHSYDLRSSGQVKLTWRVDWPMRWAYENTDFEPGGKDHSSKGGSYDTAQHISTEIFQYPPVFYLPYDFVMIRGGTGKMSSSSGELLTLSDLLAVYEPEMIRWLFASQKPNHDFALSLHEDVIRVYDEFDQGEKLALSAPPSSGKWQKKYPLIRRTYELSCLTETVPNTYEAKPPFRALCDRLQICDGSIERTLERFYPHHLTGQRSQHLFTQRARRAWHWLEHHAPKSYVFRLNTHVYHMTLSEPHKQALLALSALATEHELADLSTQNIHQYLYDKVITPSQENPQMIFETIYYKLIGRKQGPRLANFLKELGSQKVLTLLKCNTCK